MKRYYFLLFLPVFLVLGSCSTADAEKVADEFHKNLDAGNVDYIMNNLVDQEDSTPEELENFRYAIESLISQGEMTNRKKESGFNKNYNNGITTVKLSYTYEVQGTKMYERLVLISKDDGYKVLMFAMNPKESVVEGYTSAY